MKKFLLSILFFAGVCLLPASVSATTYFISSGIGSDSNTAVQAQSKTTPWAHAPYQHGFTGTYVHASGDRFIFRGGDTWVAANYFSIPNGGSSGTPDYYGVDKTWFAGASWNRPIFDIQGTLPNQDANKNSNVFAVNASWVTFDNWEVIHGTCTATGPVSQNYYALGSVQGVTVTNGYYHAFEPPSGGCGNGRTSDGNNIAIWIYEQVSQPAGCTGSFDHNVVDGTDGTGAKGYMTVVYDPSPCAPISFNVTHDLCSGFGGSFTLAHDNVIGNFGGLVGAFECSSSATIHNHAIRSNIDADIYNNVIFKTEGEGISMNPQNGTSGSHIYNNIMYANNTSAIDIGDNGTNTSGHVYIFNNTIEQQTGGDFVFGNCINLENNVGLMLIANEFHIAASGSGTGCIEAANSPFNSSGKGTAATLTYNAANDLNQTLAQANAAGYTNAQPFVYSPTSAGSPTEGIGANETALGSTLDTTYSCAEQTVAGVVQVVCPARTPNALPGSGAWPAGAYKFGSATAPIVSFNPTSLLFAGSQVGGSNSSPVILTNTGTASLVVSSVSITGSGEFTETNNCVGTIAINGTCTITVKFAPTAPGPVTGNVSVVTNASGSPQLVSLNGTGVNIGPTIPVLVGSLPTGVVGTPYLGGLTVSGDTPPDVWTANPTLPSPLNFNTATGKITGTPTATASVSETFTVTDSTGAVSVPYTTPLVINPAVVSKYVLNITPSTYTFAASGSQNIIVDDTTPGPLPFTIMTDSPWLSLCVTHNTTKVCGSTTAVSSSTYATGTVTVSTTGLAAGSYTGHIIITAGTGVNNSTVNNSPFTVPVTLTVAAPPAPSIKQTCANTTGTVTCTDKLSNIPSGSSYTSTFTSDGITVTTTGTTP